MFLAYLYRYLACWWYDHHFTAITPRIGRCDRCKKYDKPRRKPNKG